MAKTLGDFVAESRSRIREVSVDDLDELMQEESDLMILDVREREEYLRGHIPGAICVPRGVLEGAADPYCKNRHRVLCEAQDRHLALYCQTGGRSAMATDRLQQMGFTSVVNVAGGFVMWEAEDYPVSRGETI